MSHQSNPQFKAAVKQEYLPPPLETNYLSLLDIQAKMAQEFLQGSDQQKIAIIKKRIQKFFDYGNDRPHVDVDLTNDPESIKNYQHPPAQINEDLIIGLQIFTSQVIVFGKERLTLENAERLFPGFIGSEKIDDCNLKLIFTNQEDPKKILKRISKDKGTITLDHIEDPSEICNYPSYQEWFEVELKSRNYEDSDITFYVRYATNKDEILFQNDKYFRKLLGRARHLLDKKREQDQKRQAELKERAQKKAWINERKKYTVRRQKYDLKPYLKDFDTQTNYDGVYSSKPHQNYETSQETYFDHSFEEPFCSNRGSNNWRKNKKAFDDLDVSEVQDPNFYEQKRYEYNPRKRDFRRQSSRDYSIDFNPMSGHKRRQEVNVESPRDRIIQEYREKSKPKHEKKNKFYDSADYEQGYQKKNSRPMKPRLDDCQN